MPVTKALCANKYEHGMKLLNIATVTLIASSYLIPVAWNKDINLLIFGPMFRLVSYIFFQMIIAIPLLALWIVFSIVKKQMFNRFEMVIILLSPLAAFSPNMIYVHHRIFENNSLISTSSGWYVLGSIGITSLNIIFSLVSSNAQKLVLSKEESRLYSKRILWLSLFISSIVSIVFPWVPLA